MIITLIVLKYFRWAHCDVVTDFALKHTGRKMAKSTQQQLSLLSLLLLLLNQQLKTHKTDHNNKPNVIIYDNKKACMLIDAVISRNRKEIKKEAK